MNRLTLIVLAAAFAAGAAACKPDPAPPSPSKAGQGASTADSTAPSQAQMPGADTAAPRGKLPPMPQRRADTLERRGPWADGERPKRGELIERREQRRKDMLAAFDTDADGQLSDAERADMHASRIAVIVDRLDTDADGRLTKAEMEEMKNRGRRPMPDFDKVDADRDGFITVEEMAKARPPRDRRGSDPAPGTPADEPPPTP
jgi:hypothetical protein